MMKKLQKGSTGNSQRLSRCLMWACLTLAVLLPLAALYGLLQTPAVDVLRQMHLGLPSGASLESLPIAVWQSVAATCIGMMPVCAMSYGLLRARQCFSGFVRGETFSLATVRHLRSFASGLLVSGSAGLMAPTAIVWLLTMNAPGDPAILTVSLGAQQLLMLLFAGIVWQIGHAMTRAVELAEDNAQII